MSNESWIYLEHLPSLFSKIGNNQSLTDIERKVLSDLDEDSKKHDYLIIWLTQNIVYYIQTCKISIRFLELLLACPVLYMYNLSSELIAYLDNKDPEIRKLSAKFMLKQLNYNTDYFDKKTFDQILKVVFFDPNISVREAVMSYFPEESYIWLADNDIIVHLASMMNDQAHEELKCAAISLMGKISNVCPFVALPHIRNTLVNSLFIFTNKECPIDVKKRIARSFSVLLTAAQPILSTFSQVLCDAILRIMSIPDDGFADDLKAISAYTIMRLAEATPDIIAEHVPQFVNFLIYALPQAKNIELCKSIINALIALFKNTDFLCDSTPVVEQSIHFLYSTLTSIGARFKDRRLNFEIVKILGVIGAIDNSGKVQSEDTPGKEGLKNDQLIFWRFICTQLLTLVRDPSVGSDKKTLAFTALSNILVDSVEDEEVFRDYMNALLQSIEQSDNSFSLELLKMMCEIQPTTNTLFGEQILELMQSKYSTKDYKMKHIILAIILSILRDKDPTSTPELLHVVGFLIDCIKSFRASDLPNENENVNERMALTTAALGCLNTLRRKLSNFSYVIIPELTSIAVDSTTPTSIVKLTLKALVSIIIIKEKATDFIIQLLNCCSILLDSSDKEIRDGAEELLFAACEGIGKAPVIRFVNQKLIDAIARCQCCVLEVCEIPRPLSNRSFQEGEFKQTQFRKAFQNQSSLFDEKFILTTIACSPRRCIHECYDLAISDKVFASRIFKIAFITCWQAMDNELQKDTLDYLIMSLTVKKDKSKKHLSNKEREKKTTLCRLFEYMEHWEIKLSPQICMTVSKACFELWHLAQSIYFANRVLQRMTPNDEIPEAINWLISLYSKMDFEMSVRGLQTVGNNHRESADCLLELEEWTLAREAYGKVPDKYKKFTGIIQCMLHEQMIPEIVNRKNASIVKMKEFKGALEAFQIAVIKSRAPIDYYSDVMIGDPLTVQGNIVNAWRTYIEGNKEAANVYIKQGQQILADKIYDKDIVYPILIEAQQLTELKEIINGADVTNGIWDSRIKRMKPSADNYAKILYIRMIKYSPIELQTLVSQMLNFYIETGQFDIFDNAINWMFPGNDSRPAPRIEYIKIRYEWKKNKSQKCIEDLANLIKKYEGRTNSEFISHLYVHLGNWNILNNQAKNLNLRMDADVLIESNKYFKNAQMFCEEFVPAWHRFAWASSQVYYINGDQESALNAIKAHIKAVGLSDDNSALDLVQSIHFLSKIKINLFDDQSFEKIRKELMSLNDSDFCYILPQMYRILTNTEDERMVKMFQDILIRILPNHCHVAIYQLMLIANEETGESNRAIPVLEYFRKKFPIMAAEANIVSEGLIRCSYTITEHWRDMVMEARQQLSQCIQKDNNMNNSFEHKKFEACSDEIKSIEKILSDAAAFGDKERDTDDMVGFRKSLGSLCERISSKDSQEILSELNELFDRIQKATSTMKYVPYRIVYPRLAQLKDATIAVPGTYVPGGPIIRISSFASVFEVIRSKQRPRNVVIRGDDGNEYRSLLKGRSDLRVDNRVMQFFQIINQHILISERKMAIQITRYSITPLSPRCGLIQYVNGADTIYTLVSEYRKTHNIDLWKERNIMQDRSIGNIDLLRPIHRLELINDIIKNEDDTDLREILWLKSPSCREWVTRIARFAQTSALMSVVGYVLGLGDRHPANLMIHRYSGSIIHIDLSDCFEKFRDRVLFPEKIPFRLTRMMTRAFGPSGIQGDYYMTCVKMMALIRSHRDSVMAVLEAKQSDDRDETLIPRLQSVPAANIDDMQAEENFSFIDSGACVQANEMDRIKAKIQGRDFGAEELRAEEQVRILIQEAQDSYNLAHLFQGWTPLW